VRHATDAALDALAPLLERLRRPELTEKKRGIFYRKSQAFLHFHEDPAGLFADVRIDGEFQRFAASTQREQQALLRTVKRALSGQEPPASKRPPASKKSGR
jgi:hypothetical protein